MATALSPTAPPVTLGKSVTHWHRLSAALHRRAGRIEAILVVLAMLLPQLILILVAGD